MKNYINLILSIILVFLLTSCGEEKPDPRKKYKYNVLIREVRSPDFRYQYRTFYAGTTIGLASCGIIGRKAMKERYPHELVDGEWKIVCCLDQGGYNCKEEHRPGDYSVPYDEWLNDPKSHIKPRRKKL
ncbi:hypothetical protein N9W34_01725 [Rickettsiales bacterium]|nr:hypothetical protein [Rickettsiales bacterium]